MAVAGVKLRPLIDTDIVLCRQLRIILVEVELAVFGKNKTIHDETALSQHLDKLNVLQYRGPGIIGRYGMAMQVQVHPAAIAPLRLAGQYAATTCQHTLSRLNRKNTLAAQAGISDALLRLLDGKTANMAMAPY